MSSLNPELMSFIYQVYGLAFFVLGVVVHVLPKQQNTAFRFTQHLNLLGAFGMLHGIVEFLELQRLYNSDAWLWWLSCLLLPISYLPLLEFGRRTFVNSDYSCHLSAFWLYGTAGFGMAVLLLSKVEPSVGLAVGARFFVGVPAALLTAFALFNSLQTLPKRLLNNVFSVWLRIVGFAFFAYGALTLIISQSDPHLPTWLLSQADFFALFGFPVQLLRAICAVIATLGLVVLVRHIGEYNHVDATAFGSQESIVITDTNAVILRINQAFAQSTGYSAEEAVGQKISLLKSGRHDHDFYVQMWDSIARTGTWRGEIWDRRKNGEVYPKWLTITAIKNADGIVTHYVGTHIDISERKAAEEEIKQLAFYDPLTCLPNRRLLLERLKPAVASSQRSGQKGALLFIDMDNFKTLNDTLGHSMGDLLLQQVAQRLVSCVRDSDTVARLGGDEFVVMLEELSKHTIEAATQAEIIGEKIITALNQPYRLANHDYHSTPSIGAVLFDGYEAAVDDLLKQADIAMYQAKASGRNTLRFFDPQMQASINARVALETDLHIALKEQQFELYYQPQVCHNQYVIGAEALIRWHHPQRGLVFPADFIPLAEETHLILTIGQWVLETACQQIKIWADNEHTSHLQLAVNVSAKQFRQADFVEQVCQILDHSGINPNRLELELTESLVLDDIDDTIFKMKALREIGVCFSMDDFGTGHSSLTYLTRLPFNQLKIDQSFVQNISVKSTDAVIIQTITGMTSNLGMAVIAEGVETEDQRLFLEQHGCPRYQGYLFSKPVSLQAFEQLLVDS